MAKISREIRLGVSMASAVKLLEDCPQELLGSDSASLSVDVLGFELAHPIRVVCGELVVMDAPLEMAVVPFTIEADPASGSFPVLSAEIEVVAVHSGGVSLALEGEYRPPAGAVGAIADRLGLHHVAEAAIDGYFEAISRRFGKAAAALDALSGVPN